ncbi:MAG: carboxypeptidase-like regulatory domain-containing protein [Lentimicrobium sp.]|jgi:hypothetical protein|nr:carboxypeptidase-like regulatory domain-containing protein [Lentimicrobium sp.]
MKQFYKRFQRYKTIELVLDEYNAIYAGMPDVVALKQEFTNSLTEIGNLISKLSRPYQLIYRDRQVLSADFRKQMKSMLSMLLHYASKSNNQQLISLLKTYLLEYRTLSIVRLYELGLHVKDLSEINLEGLSGLGYTQLQHDDYLAHLDAFKTAIDQYHFQSNERKSDRRQLLTRFQQMELLMKNRMDTFANLVSEDHPEFFMQYRQKRRKQSIKSTTANVEDSDADISGTITMQGSGNALSMATVAIPDLDLIANTDEDGYYLFDELPAGNYTVTCHLYGFEVPSPVQFTIASGESLVVDFTLTPLPVPVLN